MIRYSRLITLLYSVWSLNGQEMSIENETSAYYKGDKWIWVSAVEPEINSISSRIKEFRSSKPLEAVPSKNDCKPYNPEVPDFSAPGRRISEAKCDEYIWNIKLMIERKRRMKECVIFRVYGGRAVAPGEFPHMGAIGWKPTIGKWEFKCGSSLISPKFVLTAAHCTSASETDTTLADPIPKIVRFSNQNIHLGPSDRLPTTAVDGDKIVDVNISKIITHPNFQAPKKYYDIALMELENEMVFNEWVQPACLWGHRDIINKLGRAASLTGWGVLRRGSFDISQELQAGEIDIINEKLCDQLLEESCNRNWCGIQDHQLCAGKLSGGIDACQGDSGGPLQIKIDMDFESLYKMYQIIGVISFGIGCAEPDLPGVYTRVSSFIDWIEKIVWT